MTFAPLSSHVAVTMLPDLQMKVPRQLYVRPLASAEALIQQPAYPSRTPAGQCWAAGGQHPRSPLKQMQEPMQPAASALEQPQGNSIALLAAKIDKLKGQEFDGIQVLQDATVQRRITAAAAVAANVPCDVVLYHNLQHLDTSPVPTSAPKLVQKQLHPSWVAKQNLKPEMADLWNAKERHQPVVTVGCLQPRVAFSNRRVAQSMLSLY